MNNKKIFITLGFVLATAFTIPVLHADEMDQATKLTFSQSVQIPGRVLPAGTYWFIRADTSSGQPNIIHIFNSDRSTLYATVFTISTLRAAPTDKTALTFVQPDSSQPKAILTWYYPGRETGHEFVYPKQEQKELSRAMKESVVAGD